MSHHPFLTSSSPYLVVSAFTRSFWFCFVISNYDQKRLGLWQHDKYQQLLWDEGGSFRQVWGDKEEGDLCIQNVTLLSISDV